MEITANDIQRFQGLYRKHFGIVLDDGSARHKLSMLITQMAAIYKPITQMQFNDLKNENEKTSATANKRPA